MLLSKSFEKHCNLRGKAVITYANLAISASVTEATLALIGAANIYTNAAERPIRITEGISC